MTWIMSPIFFKLGSVTIYYYGLFFFLTPIIGFLFYFWQMRRSGYSYEQSRGLILPILLAVLIGSRLGYIIIDQPLFYLQHPLQAVKFWQGGMNSFGAAIVASFTVLWFAKKTKVPFLILADNFSLYALWAIIMIRLGNFFNSEAIGIKTNNPWAIQFPLSRQDSLLFLENVPFRHPSQLYELFLAAFIFILLLIIELKWKTNKKMGLLVGLFLLLYFGVRFFLEFLKQSYVDNPVYILSLGQWFCLPFIFIGGYLVLIKARRFIL